MMEQMRSEAQNQVAILALNFCVGCRLREGWEVHPTPIESEEQAKSVEVADTICGSTVEQPTVLQSTHHPNISSARSQRRGPEGCSRGVC